MHATMSHSGSIILSLEDEYGTLIHLLLLVLPVLEQKNKFLCLQHPLLPTFILFLKVRLVTLLPPAVLETFLKGHYLTTVSERSWIVKYTTGQYQSHLLGTSTWYFISKSGSQCTNFH